MKKLVFILLISIISSSVCLNCDKSQLKSNTKNQFCKCFKSFIPYNQEGLIATDCNSFPNVELRKEENKLIIKSSFGEDNFREDTITQLNNNEEGYTYSENYVVEEEGIIKSYKFYSKNVIKTYVIKVPNEDKENKFIVEYYEQKYLGNIIQNTNYIYENLKLKDEDLITKNFNQEIKIQPYIKWEEKVEFKDDGFASFTRHKVFVSENKIFNQENYIKKITIDYYFWWGEP